MELIESRRPATIPLSNPQPPGAASEPLPFTDPHGLRRDACLCRPGLNVERGERTVLVAKWAGKSTLLKILARRRISAGERDLGHNQDSVTSASIAPTS